MAKRFSQSDLEGYLDEALPPEEMAQMEQAMRDDPAINDQLAQINSRRDAGVHSLAEIWRRHRLSCPPREELGNYLLGVLPQETTHYLKFHLEVLSCRYCQANLADLENQQAESSTQAEARKRKYFQSSAGYLGRK